MCVNLNLEEFAVELDAREYEKVVVGRVVARLQDAEVAIGLATIAADGPRVSVERPRKRRVVRVAFDDDPCLAIR